ncbi:ADC synthase [Volvox carteri f. nagariensis]|uniref:aminodeoxychorismate synthase n=1 Tax=Volvox carteri f. nagariensis TaxID=3068 RepID=D8TKT9_VOLCA|nr:ADC synthase [Volvox carteri f. nagariensis]EFJ52124.1 ADC synthase [Volvox carteri f. nagariensis]|eukprot:XP_002946898.1 ADC synthase [Volvox carteri f. nagariensis]
MRTLLIDNYDSYTYNLFQAIAEVNGELPVVYYNDKITINQIQSMVQAGTVHSIVISPGPGNPNNPSDVGVCVDVLQQLSGVPILGICLGHQALAMAHGASVVSAPEPVHGRLSSLRHNGHALFKDIPSADGFEVVRYHSLLVDEHSLPDCLEAVCWTTGGHSAVKLARDAAPAASASSSSSSLEGRSSGERAEVGIGHYHHRRQHDEASPSGCGCLLMGLAHRARPHYGVQFHPESIATRYGIALLRNFRDLAAEHIKRRGGPLAAQLPPVRWVLRRSFLAPSALPALPAWPPPEHQRGATLRLLWSRLATFLPRLQGGSQAIFELLYGWAEDTFWLDSAAADRGRFSYMGGRGGPLWRNPAHPATKPAAQRRANPGGSLTIEGPEGRAIPLAAPSGFLSFLQMLLDRQRLLVEAEAAAQLPFNFWGGLVGYLGYELKAECGAANAHAAATPDAVMYLADRLIAVDHATGDVFLMAVYDSAAVAAAAGNDGDGSEGDGFVEGDADSRGRRVLREAGWGKLSQSEVAESAAEAASAPVTARMMPFTLAHGRTAYLQNIAACHAALHAGESYEVCLTTALTRGAAPRPDQLYKTLRQLNPAPYAAWLQCGAAGPTVCCSSPERFLRGDRGGLLEARPIKGTAARVATDPEADAAAAAKLASSEKERAENLMIVDLLRNDLGRVCEVGSVHVPGLMDIESYATVHQMVSTVRGVRRAGVSIVDCIRAAFPGGSMTGAPKVRTMQIIDALEDRARGIYSGSIGFISFNDTFDLNIVIRTATRTMTIGAGGAIVVQSQPEAEYDEMRLKARALLRAVGLCEGAAGPIPVMSD